MTAPVTVIDTVDTKRSAYVSAGYGGLIVLVGMLGTSLDGGIPFFRPAIVTIIVLGVAAGARAYIGFLTGSKDNVIFFRIATAGLALGGIVILLQVWLMFLIPSTAVPGPVSTP